MCFLKVHSFLFNGVIKLFSYSYELNSRSFDTNVILTEERCPAKMKVYALRSMKNKSVTCRIGRVQTIAGLKADLPDEQLNGSTAFIYTGVNYFGLFTLI